MTTEPRHLTDQELEFSIQNQLTIDKQQRIIEESNILELKKKFNLTYISYSNDFVTVESENFRADISKYSMNSNITMLCKLDVKDIKTFDEFQTARDIITKEKQKTLTGLYWIAFRTFQERI